jgi:glucan 1,3-beta-glucosidase
MWDSHIRLGGGECLESVWTFTVNNGELLFVAAGTNLQTSCPEGSDNTQCTAAFLSMHLTAGSTAYLEVRMFIPFQECSS